MKSVTPEQLIELVTPYLVKKMEANSHKDSPFKLGHVYLVGRMDEEVCEAEEAMLDYFDKKNDETKQAFIDENADVINFAMYQIGKLLGCEVLVRGDDMKDKPRGIRNNNPGNVRENDRVDFDWDGEHKEDLDSEFEEFESMVYGIRAMTKILITYRDKHGLKNPAAVINRWAPPSENDTKAYIYHVEKCVKRKNWKMESNEALEEYVKAICIHENGHKYAGDWMPYVRDGVALAMGIDLVKDHTAYRNRKNTI